MTKDNVVNIHSKDHDRSSSFGHSYLSRYYGYASSVDGINLVVVSLELKTCVVRKILL